MSTLREQVQAMRDQARGIVAVADRLLGQLPDPHASAPEGPCSHPPERRLEAARMGAPRGWVCECGHEGEGP